MHSVCDGRGRNLATRLTPGQDADTSELVGLVDQVWVAREAWAAFAPLWAGLAGAAAGFGLRAGRS